MTPLELLGIDETDLSANRAGHLSPRQLRRLRRRAAIGIVSFALPAALLAFVAESTRDWLVPAMVSLAWFGLAALIVRVAAGKLRETETTVRRLTGPVTLGMVARERAGTLGRWRIVPAALVLASLACSPHRAGVPLVYHQWPTPGGRLDPAG